MHFIPTLAFEYNLQLLVKKNNTQNKYAKRTRLK